MCQWEAKLLEAEGRIESIGGKFWRLTAESCATVRASETGDGLLSREIPGWLRKLIRQEMAARPAY